MRSTEEWAERIADFVNKLPTRPRALVVPPADFEAFKVTVPLMWRYYLTADPRENLLLTILGPRMIIVKGPPDQTEWVAETESAAEPHGNRSS